MLKSAHYHLIVMSGKGGVGKSSLVRGLALSLARDFDEVRVLDIDLTGPSMERLLDVSEKPLEIVEIDCAQKWKAKKVTESVRVMSIASLLKSDSDAVIWRGPKKCAFIERLVNSVHWSDRSSNNRSILTIIDTPPGTSDEHLAIIDSIKRNIDRMRVRFPSTRS